MKLPKNIDLFIKKCADYIAEVEKEYFYSDTCNECLEYPETDHEMESPIEMVLYIAIKVLVKLNSPGLKMAEPIETPTGTYSDGVFIRPQKRIDKYRTDFLISFDMPLWKGKEYRKQVIVECDSQEFHERTEKERRYEKERDRKIQSDGYKVFRYTGREILEQPFAVAAEILNEIVPWAHGKDYFIANSLEKIKVLFPPKK